MAPLLISGDKCTLQNPLLLYYYLNNIISRKKHWDIFLSCFTLILRFHSTNKVGNQLHWHPVFRFLIKEPPNPVLTWIRVDYVLLLYLSTNVRGRTFTVHMTTHLRVQQMSYTSDHTLITNQIWTRTFNTKLIIDDNTFCAQYVSIARFQCTPKTIDM